MRSPTSLVPAPTAELPKISGRADIQGLRALAVVLVVLNHAGIPFLPGGFIGVDVFFVVSGYLISSILLHEATATGKVKVGAFYARRARRILPAATLVLVVTTVFAALETSAERAHQVAQDVRWAAFFVANVHYSRLGTDYFARQRLPSPVEHYWSLSVEEQFYLVWPMLLTLVVAAGAVRAFSPAVRARARMPLVTVVVGVVAVVSFGTSVLATRANLTAAYFSSLGRAWELATGVLLALAAPLWPRLPAVVRNLLTLAGLAGLAVAATRFGIGTPFPGWHALLPVLATAALLVVGAGGAPVGPGALLTLRPVTWVGDLSYSLYLWHWPVLVLGVRYAGAHPSPVETTALLGIALGLSVVSLHLVENPFRYGRVRLARGRTALALWPLALGSVLVATTWAHVHTAGVEQHRTTEAARYYAAHPLRSLPRAPGPGTDRGPVVPASRITVLIDRSLALADAKAPFPFPLVNLHRLDEDVWNRRYPCHAAYTDARVALCPLGRVGARRTVVAVGDSHMGMWLPSLDVLGRRNGFRVLAFVKYSCPAFEVPMRSLTRTGPYTECTAFRAWTRDQIARIRPDLVVMGGLAFPPELMSPGTTRAAVWRAGVRTSVRRMRRLAPAVRVLGDAPRFAVDPGDCISSSGSTMATCTLPTSAKVDRVNTLTRTASAAPGTRYVEVVPLVCASGRCPLVVDRVVTYRDNDHISITWGRRLASELGSLLRLPPGLRRLG